jgi:hypothetical protein
MQPSHGQVGKAPHCSYTNNAGTHHRHQQDDHQCAQQLYPKYLSVDQFYLAYPLLTIQDEGGPRAHRKARTPSQRCKLGHLLTHLYAFIAYALSENKRFLADSSPEFQTLIKSLWSGYFFCNVKDQIRHILFAIKRSAKLVHQSRCQYNITKSMRQEIEFFCEKLLPKSGICWESPIAHIIPRMLTFVTFGDSCLKGAGGYSLYLGFWWHLPFPKEVKLCTLLHKRDNTDGLLISINVLEFITVIINYCAALHMVLSKNPTNNPYPVLLNVIDNPSALSWTMGACHKSRIGRLLARFFCLLLINSLLGINSQWISRFHNAIADDISCAKTAVSEYTHSHPSFDYSALQQKYLELSHCSFFWPAPELISFIWEIVLT